jgi:hypothetical protein
MAVHRAWRVRRQFLRGAGVLCLLGAVSGATRRTELGTSPAAVAAVAPAAPELAVDTLRDVAMTIHDSAGFVILYNPRIQERLGPLLSAFFMAHERGHVALGHRLPVLSGTTGARGIALLRAEELEADCYAARTLAGDRPDILSAAIGYFTALGASRNDLGHPSGFTRARHLRSCAPADSTPPAEPVEITVSLASPSSSVRWQDVRLRFGDGSERLVSNLRASASILREHLQPGLHAYRLEVDLYTMDGTQQLNPAGHISGVGRIAVTGARQFRVVLETGEDGTAFVSLTDAAEERGGGVLQ